MTKKVLITGGSGFLGAAVCKRMLAAGYEVRVFDDNSRGHPRRLASIAKDIEFVEGDIRDEQLVAQATNGMDWVFHLAFINGTKFFYERPDLVLDVGIRGALNTIGAAKKYGVEKYIMASSSEVYQQPTIIPTTEDERIIIPDISNPRFSYSGGKILSELLTLHYFSDSDTQRIIFRPHNVFGPDMGWEHVIPEFMRRVRFSLVSGAREEADFEIQGDGSATRAFCFVDDAANGVIIAAEHGRDGNLYNIGVDEETSIAQLAHDVGALAGLKLNIIPTQAPSGGTSRRCPDVSRIKSLGYRAEVNLKQGLEACWDWYSKAPLP
jgi:nucleoside-diphosphate-sugar epimerase